MVSRTKDLVFSLVGHARAKLPVIASVVTRHITFIGTYSGGWRVVEFVYSFSVVEVVASPLMGPVGLGV